MKIKHYIKVARHFSPRRYIFWLALCHDLVEDGYAPKFILRAWKDLDALTRIKEEPYFDYINRLSERKNARLVKFADLEENMKRCNESLKKRYEKAYSILSQLK